MSYEEKSAAAGDEDIPDFAGYWEMVSYEGVEELQVCSFASRPHAPGSLQ